jgi:predicted permease
MALYQKLLEEMNTVPGVQSATLSRLRLMSGRWFRNVQKPSAVAATNQASRVYCNPVGPHFFQTMGIGLRLGRDFSTSDTETAPRVAIISHSMAQRLFPGESPIGQRLTFADQANVDVQVVGVVSNIKHDLHAEQPSDAVYIPYPQAPPNLLGQMNIVVRTSTDPGNVVPNIRDRVLSIDRNLPLVHIETQETEIDEYLGGERSLATLLTFFGALALVLASTGLYGTMSYRVSRRTKELGIRMALGADAREMLVMVLRETLWLAGIGVAIGIPLSITAARLIASILFGVKTTDTVTMLVAVLLMCAVAVVAGYFPARRAAKVDPMAALRYE